MKITKIMTFEIKAKGVLDIPTLENPIKLEEFKNCQVTSLNTLALVRENGSKFYIQGILDIPLLLGMLTIISSERFISYPKEEMDLELFKIRNITDAFKLTNSYNSYNKEKFKLTSLTTEEFRTLRGGILPSRLIHQRDLLAEELALSFGKPQNILVMAKEFWVKLIHTCHVSKN
jgi:hypothetical protein